MWHVDLDFWGVPRQGFGSREISVKVHHLMCFIGLTQKTHQLQRQLKVIKKGSEDEMESGAEINIFSHAPRLNPKIPLPTSLDGVKPSFMEKSEGVISSLAVTGYQKLTPLLMAAASSKDVIEKGVMFKDTLFDILNEISSGSQLSLTKRLKISWQNSRHSKIDSIKQSQGWSNKTYFCDTLFFTRLQAIRMSWLERTSNSVQAQSLDWGFGVKWFINSQGRQKTRTVFIAQADHVTCWDHQTHQC